MQECTNEFPTILAKFGVVIADHVSNDRSHPKAEGKTP